MKLQSRGCHVLSLVRGVCFLPLAFGLVGSQTIRTSCWPKRDEITWQAFRRFCSLRSLFESCVLSRRYCYGANALEYPIPRTSLSDSGVEAVSWCYLFPRVAKMRLKSKVAATPPRLVQQGRFCRDQNATMISPAQVLVNYGCPFCNGALWASISITQIPAGRDRKPLKGIFFYV